MHRFWLIPLALIAFLAAPAHASGDYSCSPSWKLAHSARSECDNMALLGPGNDTRVNLMLLLLDRHAIPAPQAPKSADPLFDWRTLRDAYYPRPDALDAAYAEGEGSRCRSNDTGTAAFLAALEASKVPQMERRPLADARTALKPDCAAERTAASPSDSIPGVTSEEGRAFTAYLLGSLAFYDADYDAARTRFTSLAKARNAWLRETALYMAARVEVNRAQLTAYDEYGTLRTDRPLDLSAADRDLRAYLKAYPKGPYAVSAQGLLRRVYWLGNDKAKLSAEYSALFARPLPGLDDGRLAQEVDDKLLSGLTAKDITDPTLLAVYDLLHMRWSEEEGQEGCCDTAMTAADLERQAPSFAKDQSLFTFLQATHAFHVAKQPRDVIRLIPDAARQKSFSTLEYSRQMLRGMALEAVKDRNARGFWLDMLPGASTPWQRSAIELAIAAHDERAGALARIYAADSLVKTPAIREIALMNVAGADLLRQQAKSATVPQHERDLALLTLLYKSVSRGGYQDFVTDLALVPADAASDIDYWSLLETEKPPVGVFTRTDRLGDYGCPPLRATAAALAKNPKAVTPRLCLADFLRVNGFDMNPLDTQPSADQLGGTKSLFPGAPYSRLEVYKAIIADPAASAPDKAYALYRAVMCYGPSGNNSCGGIEVAKDIRKGWFTRLKKDYPQSKWATSLRYYW